MTLRTNSACAVRGSIPVRMRRIECLRNDYDADYSLRREPNLRTALFAYDLRKRRKKIRLFRRPYLAWAAPPRDQLYLYAGVCIT